MEVDIKKLIEKTRAMRDKLDNKLDRYDKNVLDENDRWTFTLILSVLETVDELAEKGAIKQ